MRLPTGTKSRDWIKGVQRTTLPWFPLKQNNCSLTLGGDAQTTHHSSYMGTVWKESLSSDFWAHKYQECVYPDEALLRLYFLRILRNKTIRISCWYPTTVPLRACWLIAFQHGTAAAPWHKGEDYREWPIRPRTSSGVHCSVWGTCLAPTASACSQHSERLFLPWNKLGSSHPGQTDYKAVVWELNFGTMQYISQIYFV